jgi:hypothetical protein
VVADRRPCGLLVGVLQVEGLDQTCCLDFCVHLSSRFLRGLKQDGSARVVIAGHAFVQNVRRGCFELAVGEPASRRVAVAFDELALAI